MSIMKMPSDYVNGTITLTNGSVDFTGTGTAWQLVGFDEGDLLIDVAGATQFWALIDEITSNTAGKLTRPWAGPDLVGVAYRLRFTSDGVRSTAQAAMLRQQLGNGNIQALAGLSGSANQLPMFTAPGAMTLISKTDLVSGADYDVQVDLLADRALYDGQVEGFSVLVSNVGDGRAAIYSKVTAASGDWSDPAYVTGPGSTVPGPSGITWKEGTYNPATVYVLNDGVLYNGSSWRALQTTTGNAPPTLPTTSNPFWELLARQGIDGAGTVNAVVAGAGIEVNNADPTAPVVSLANMAPSTIKGRATAGSGAPEDLTPAQASTVLRPERISFRAHKNGTSQINIPSGVATKITFGTEAWDTGGYYNPATSRFTPPAGKYRLTTSLLTNGGAVDQAAFGALIYRNGVQNASSYDSWSGAINKAASISVLVDASGTDYFEVYFEGFGAGDKGLNGAATATWFCGEEL